MYKTLIISPADTTLECRNLRLTDTPEGKTLTPVGIPRVIIKDDTPPQPFHTFRHPDGAQSLFLHSGSRLFVLIGEAAEPVEIATLPSEPLCAVSGDSSIIVMTADGPFYLDFSDGTWQPRGMMPEFPPIAIIADSFRDFTATTDQRTLTGSYSHWSGSLTSDDVALLTADALDAYSQAAENARSAGYFIQPVVACYRLRDAKGGLLYQSPPVMIAPDGFQGCAPFTPEVSNYSIVAGYAVTLRGYRIRLQPTATLDSAWAQHVASMELLISPQIHPVDFSALIDYRCQDGTETDTLRISLPGTSPGNVAGTLPRTPLRRCPLNHSPRW